MNAIRNPDPNNNMANKIFSACVVSMSMTYDFMSVSDLSLRIKSDSVVSGVVTEQ